MKYYPLNRVKTNQKTNGERFAIGGVPYKGPYYETYDGNFFTGPNPIQGPSQLLTDIENPSLGGSADTGTPRYKTNENSEASKLPATLTNIRVAANSELTSPYQTPKSHFPQPTDDDYARRSFTRYFAKKRGQAGFVIEIDQTTYDALKAADETYDYINYECISTLWQLAGPLHDDRTNKQYKIAGIIDTNERLINAKEPGFPGLKAFIGGEYAKFAKPTK